jgi:DNA-binding Lrp family transcriptional regulator
VDELDAQIVRLMEQNARQTSDMLAKQVSVSSATVRRRLKRLFDARELHIEAYGDPLKSELPVTALIGLSIEHELHEEVMGTIRRLHNVSWASTTTGQFDSFIFVRSSSTEHLYQFIKDVLLKIAGIKDSEIFVCLHVEKSSRLS